jgi:hypothetical protein
MFIDEIHAQIPIKPEGVFDLENVGDLCQREPSCFSDLEKVKFPFDATIFISKYENTPLAVFCLSDNKDKKVYLFYFLRHKGKAYQFFESTITLKKNYSFDTFFVNSKDQDEWYYSDHLPTELKHHVGIYETFMNDSILFALRLMECKNIETVSVEIPEKLKKKREKKWKVEFERTYVLAIEPKTKKYIDAREDMGSVGGVAFHICRGHFAEYGTGGRGLLFGKHSGRFWIPAHAKGDKSIGVVNKSYQVNPLGEG